MKHFNASTIAFALTFGAVSIATPVPDAQISHASVDPDCPGCTLVQTLVVRENAAGARTTASADPDCLGCGLVIEDNASGGLTFVALAIPSSETPETILCAGCSLVTTDAAHNNATNGVTFVGYTTPSFEVPETILCPGCSLVTTGTGNRNAASGLTFIANSTLAGGDPETILCPGCALVTSSD